MLIQFQTIQCRMFQSIWRPPTQIYLRLTSYPEWDPLPIFVTNYAIGSISLECTKIKVMTPFLLAEVSIYSSQKENLEFDLVLLKRLKHFLRVTHLGRVVGSVCTVVWCGCLWWKTHVTRLLPSQHSRIISNSHFRNSSHSKQFLRHSCMHFQRFQLWRCNFPRNSLLYWKTSELSSRRESPTSTHCYANQVWPHLIKTWEIVETPSGFKWIIKIKLKLWDDVVESES